MILKNLKYFVLSFAVGAAFLSGCNKDEETTKKLNPVITLDATTTADKSTLLPGAEVRINFTATKGADGKDLSTLKVYRASNGGAEVEIAGATQTKIGKSSVSADLKYTLQTIDKATDVFRIEVVDEGGNKASRSLTYYTKDKSDTTKVEKPKVVGTMTFSKSKQHLSTSVGTVYNDTEGQANKATVDLSYFFSTTSGNNFASPVARNNSSIYATFAITWGAVSTEIKTTSLSKSQFDELKDKDQKELTTVYTNGTLGQVVSNDPGTRINKDSFIAGKVIAYKNTATGKISVAYINSVASDENGAASVEIITQN